MAKEFTILEKAFSIHRFNRNEHVPAEVYSADHFWIGKTNDELSIVCEGTINLKSQLSDHGWSVFKLIGPFALNSVGILAEVSAVLSKQKISIFTLSTYDTDYILIKQENIEKAVNALVKSGYKKIKQ